MLSLVKPEKRDSLKPRGSEGKVRLGPKYDKLTGREDKKGHSRCEEMVLASARVAVSVALHGTAVSSSSPSQLHVLSQKNLIPS